MWNRKPELKQNGAWSLKDFGIKEVKLLLGCMMGSVGSSVFGT